MEEIVVSAPGKVILHGEHAVVYGKVAVASALNLRTYLRIRQKNDGKITLNLPSINVSAVWQIENLKNKLQMPLCDPSKPGTIEKDILDQLKEIAGIDRDSTKSTDLALIAFLYLLCSIVVTNGELPSIEVVVSSHLPIGAGLGSSAAYAVCLSAGFLKLGKHLQTSSGGTKDGHWTRDSICLINDWAFQGEKIIHGNPSGIDNSVSSYGGAIQFQAGKITPIDNMPKLRILLVNTKIPRSTKTLVAGVKERYEKLPKVLKPIMDSTDAIVEECQSIFTQMVEAGNKSNTDHYYTELQVLIDMNHHLLAAMGVSHPALDNIVMVTKKHNLFSKLTGAGGGGCAFTLIRPAGTTEDQISQVIQELKDLGYDCWETSVGANGVQEHEPK